MSRAHIPAENLAVWREAADDNRELRHLQIEALATQAAALLAKGEEMDPTRLGLMPILRENDIFRQMSAVDERMAFCKALFRLRPPQAEKPLPSPPSSPRVARLSGAVFSAAWEQFAPLLPNALPVPLSTLSELLEEIAAGNADFAIFPIEDTRGNRFLHFYEEFERLELYITADCRGSHEENGYAYRFLLLSKQFSVLPSPVAALMAEYCLPGEDPRQLTEFLTAADAAGMTLLRLDSQPALYPEGSFTYYPVLHTTGEGAALLRLYLQLFLPRVSAIATYAHIKGV